METLDINNAKEVNAFYFSILCRSNNQTILMNAKSNLLSIFREASWFDVPGYLNNNKNKGTLFQNAKNIEWKSSADLFFNDLLSKDIQTKSKDIIHYNLLFYKEGYFINFINNFNTYVKLIQNYDENEIHNIVFKYFIACVMFDKLNECIENIQFIKQNYTLYNYDVYLFMLNIIKGNVFKFNNTKENSKVISLIFKLTNNIHNSFWELISKQQLSLYVVITMLANYNDSLLNKIISQQHTLVYDLYMLYPMYFELLIHLKKCKFNLLFEYINSHQYELGSDAVIAVYSETILKTIRLNVLKDISDSIKEIPIDTLKDMLCVNDSNEIEQLVMQLITTFNVNLVINDVKNTICALDNSNEVNDTMIKCIEVCKRNISNVMKHILNAPLKGRINKKELDQIDSEHHNMGYDNNGNESDDDMGV